MYRSLLNNKGYTLLSALLSLTILCTITFFIIYLINPMNVLTSYNYFSHYEIRQFQFFIQSELNKSKNILIEKDKIHFIYDDETIVTFEKYNDVIRRRVNFTGHEIILQNVSQLDIKRKNPNYFELVISRGDGYEHTQIYFYKEEYPK